MSDITADFIRELLKRRDGAKDKAARERLARDFAKRDRKPPDDFIDSSFLYIRSYDADQGVRPFSNIVHWHSPDITLAPATNPAAYTNELNAGETYVIRIVLRNRGDLAVPSAKVELYLTDPSIGFDTRFATKLTNLTNTPAAWVTSGGATAVEFHWTVPPTEAGHKCLFARCFSFSPLDLPFDDFALDPRLDRHVAQQNLNIAAQAQPFQFNLIHLPNANMRLRMRPMTVEEIFGLRHPVLADVRPMADVPQRGWGRLTGIKLTEPAKGAEGEMDTEGLVLRAEDRDAMNIKETADIKRRLRAVLADVATGETKLSAHREFLGQVRKMNAEARVSRVAMDVPELDLAKDQVMGLEISATDESLDGQDPVGGITLLVRGG